MADEVEKSALTIHTFRTVSSTAIQSMGLSHSLDNLSSGRARPICSMGDLSLGLALDRIIKSRHLFSITIGPPTHAARYQEYIQITEITIIVELAHVL